MILIRLADPGGVLLTPEPETRRIPLPRSRRGVFTGPRCGRADLPAGAAMPAAEPDRGPANVSTIERGVAVPLLDIGGMICSSREPGSGETSPIDVTDMSLVTPAEPSSPRPVFVNGRWGGRGTGGPSPGESFFGRDGAPGGGAGLGGGKTPVSSSGSGSGSGSSPAPPPPCIRLSKPSASGERSTPMTCSTTSPAGRGGGCGACCAMRGRGGTATFPRTPGNTGLFVSTSLAAQRREAAAELTSCGKFPEGNQRKRVAAG